MAFIACGAANRVLRFNTSSRTVDATIPLSNGPSGLVLTDGEAILLATCIAPEGHVCLIDPVKKEEILQTTIAGPTSTASVLSQDGRTVYVCDRFNNDVRVFDLATRKETARIPVRREPVAAALTLDGKHLLVANQLPTGRADADTVVAVVSVIDVAQGKVAKELMLPNGSGELRGIKVSPDGKYAAVTHIVADFQHATSYITTGWIVANAMTLIDLAKMEVHFSFLLDERNNGAANPRAIAWSADGSVLAVTHAGTHEVSIIDFPALLAATGRPIADYGPRHRERGTGNAAVGELAAAKSDPRKSAEVFRYVSRYEGLDKGLPFLVGARRRIKLPAGDLGPRAIVIVGRTAYVANYFSDTLSIFDVTEVSPKVDSIPLGPKRRTDLIRKGEFYFHDAGICREGWMSCASCHPEGRADGFNWDLLNDGIGNPKNTKSLLLAHQTPPAMSTGVRQTAEAAVRAGITHILFTEQPDSVATAIDAYLRSLRPVPSPYLVGGKLSEAAVRGEKVFRRAGCVECHPPRLFTDRQSYDVGTRRSFEAPSDRFDTPTLIEVWRTAPYLHDGSAVTIRDVLTRRNPEDKHGCTSRLSPDELNDLCAYILSL